MIARAPRDGLVIVVTGNAAYVLNTEAASTLPSVIQAASGANATAMLAPPPGPALYKAVAPLIEEEPAAAPPKPRRWDDRRTPRPPVRRQGAAFSRGSARGFRR